MRHLHCLSLLAVLVVSSCESPEADRCNVDGDCEPDEICADGACAPRPCPDRFRDADGDGHGAPGSGEPVCDAIDGFVLLDDDCDDTDADVHPGATEAPADATDADCDGTELCFVDADGDGFGSTFANGPVASSDITCASEGLADVEGDCDDSDAAVGVGAPELVDDGVDQDCDGQDACLADGDDDGFAASADRLANDEDGDLDCGTGSGVARELGDCDDGNGSVFPGATEVPGDGVDSSCDGVELCFRDEDDDGFGTSELVPSPNDTACAAPGVAANADDCDDADRERNPAGAEVVADGVDQDCDGEDRCPADNDGDGFAGQATRDDVDGDLDCATGAGVTTVTGDCDDGADQVFPGASEEPADGIDANCDGLELCFEDGDGDGFGGTSTRASLTLSCREPVGIVAGLSPFANDCDDVNAAVFPGVPCDDNDICTDNDLCGDDGKCTGFPAQACTCGTDCSDSPTCCALACPQFEPCDTCASTTCDFDCTGSGCEAECVDGAVCDVATNATFTQVRCDSSTCRVATDPTSNSIDLTCVDSVCVLFGNATSAQVTCDGSVCTGSMRGASVDCVGNASCDLDCPAGVCSATCQDSSSCVYACAAGAICDFDCQSGQEQSCGSGVTVCNRPCPP